MTDSSGPGLNFSTPFATSPSGADAVIGPGLFGLALCLAISGTPQIEQSDFATRVRHQETSPSQHPGAQVEDVHAALVRVTTQLIAQLTTSATQLDLQTERIILTETSDLYF